MKTLVLFGSARANGHTKAMLDLFLETLGGEVEIIDAYRTELEIAPCKDCRFYWHKNGCSIKDGMVSVYEKLEEADNIVLASPIYFHSISGKLKTIIDRLQPYWASCLRKDKPEAFRKTGSILMVGGAPSFENQFLGGDLVLKNLLKDMSIHFTGEVTLPNSDRDSLETRPDIADEIRALAQKVREANGL